MPVPPALQPTKNHHHHQQQPQQPQQPQKTSSGSRSCSSSRSSSIHCAQAKDRRGSGCRTRPCSHACRTAAAAGSSPAATGPVANKQPPQSVRTECVAWCAPAVRRSRVGARRCMRVVAGPMKPVKRPASEPALCSPRRTCALQVAWHQARCAWRGTHLPWRGKRARSQNRRLTARHVLMLRTRTRPRCTTSTCAIWLPAGASCPPACPPAGFGTTQPRASIQAVTVSTELPGGGGSLAASQPAAARRVLTTTVAADAAAPVPAPSNQRPREPLSSSRRLIPAQGRVRRRPDRDRVAANLRGGGPAGCLGAIGIGGARARAKF